VNVSYPLNHRLNISDLLSFPRSDYASSAGLARAICSDLNIAEKAQSDLIYTLYLDDPTLMGGERQRFAAGILVDKTGRDKKKQLLDMNEEIRKVGFADGEHVPLEKLWGSIEYKSESLPSLDAAVVQFPFTNGFVSALTHSYKVCIAVSVCRLSCASFSPLRPRECY
jgi:hypothetical protein